MLVLSVGTVAQLLCNCPSRSSALPRGSAEMLQSGPRIQSPRRTDLLPPIKELL